jgi:hypothetical protein
MRPVNIAALLLAATAACQPKSQATPAPIGSDPRKVTVHEVLTDGSLTGLRVEVTGTCRGYSTPTIAQGPPPLTRSDWQLEDQGEAVWVSGPMPPGCSATEPAETPSTITATVAQDTLPSLGGRDGTVRQYLVES